MLGIESLVVFGATGGVAWIGEARYRTDWIFTVDAPACPQPGAYGGCGVGVGTLSFLQIRPRGWRWWFEAGGGWYQQRIANDDLRTVAESALVLTPISAVYELSTDLDAPVALRTFVGPGFYLGMHNAHVHPTVKGRHMYDVPWSEMYPLDVAAGPGGRAEARVVFARRLGIEADVVVAPMWIGGPITVKSPEIAPLDFDRQGMTWWRKASVGLSWDDPKILPFRPMIAFFAAELSDRAPDRIGHRGAMIQFDVPLRVGRTEK